MLLPGAKDLEQTQVLVASAAQLQPCHRIQLAALALLRAAARAQRSLFTAPARQFRPDAPDLYGRPREA